MSRILSQKDQEEGKKLGGWEAGRAGG